jgi:hypothetical protein
MGALRLGLASRIPGFRLASGEAEAALQAGMELLAWLWLESGLVLGGGAAGPGMVFLPLGARSCRSDAAGSVLDIDWRPVRRPFGGSYLVGLVAEAVGTFGSCVCSSVVRQCWALGSCLALCVPHSTSAAVGVRVGPWGVPLRCHLSLSQPRRGFLVRRWWCSFGLQ